MLRLLAYGRSSESPWLWILIPAGAVAMYFVDRAVSRKTGRPMQRFGGIGLAAWYWQAIFFAIAGSGIVYQLASNHVRSYWWVLAVAAWLGFARAVVTRKP